MSCLQFRVCLLASAILNCHDPLSFALDPRTHVWVGQQVLNDVLPDGKVTIDGFEYAVEARLVAALRQYSAEYRMGHIGPDASPDALVGQTYIHPGVDEHWQTDDWMKHVLDEAANDQSAIAYAYGMFGHVAGDMMMHTYVNMYAGDYFILTDGETDIELRHFTLEHYIGDRTPPIDDHLGRRLGPPDRIVKLPKAFITDALILNPSAADQYRKQTGNASHLLAMHEAKKTVHKLYSDAAALEIPTTNEIDWTNKEISRSQERLVELSKLINDTLPRIASQRENVRRARLAVIEQRRTVDQLSAADEVLRTKLAQADETLARIEVTIVDHVDYIENIAPENIRKWDDRVQQAEREIERWGARIPQLEADIAHFNRRLEKIEVVISDLNDVIKPYGDACNLSPTCRAAKESRKAARSTRSTLQGNLGSAKDNLNTVKTNLASAHRNLTRARARVKEWSESRDAWIAQLTMWTASKALWQEERTKILDELAQLNLPLRQAKELLNELEHNLFELEAMLKELDAQLASWQEELDDLNQRLPDLQRRLPVLQELKLVLDGVVSFLRRWDADITRATQEYSVAAVEAILASMRGEGLDGILRPLQDWQRCWLPVYTGLPREVVSPKCKAEYLFRELVEHVQQLKATALDAAFSVIPITRLLYDVQEDLKTDLVEASIELGEKWIPPAMLHYYAFMTRGTSQSTLNDVFERDSSGKQLLTFNRISDLIDDDLGVYRPRISRARPPLFHRLFPRRRAWIRRSETYLGEPRFDPQVFSVAPNAVNLVKMTLLTRDELNQMPKNYGLSGPFTKYGKKLYPDGEEFVNVLFHAVRSIDGHHAWQGNGLPPLRRNGRWDCDAKSDFGYPWEDCGERRKWGFRLWEEVDVRSQVFNKIFRTEDINGTKYVFPKNLVRLVPPKYPACLAETKTPRSGDREPALSPPTERVVEPSHESQNPKREHVSMNPGLEVEYAETRVEPVVVDIGELLRKLIDSSHTVDFPLSPEEKEVLRAIPTEVPSPIPQTPIPPRPPR